MAKNTATVKVKKLPKTRLKALERALDKNDSTALAKLDMALGDSVAPEEWKRGFAAMSAPRARYLASFYLLTEVNNGGFNQFLFNKGPEAVAPALALLEDRGIADVAALLRKAVNALPGKRLPKTNEQLADILTGDKADKIDSAHAKLDDKFFESDASERMTRAALEFVRDNATEFFE